MLGNHRHHTLGAIGRTRLDERSDLGVAAGAYRLRQERVGDIANEDVLEGVLVLARQAAAGGGDHEVSLLQALQRGTEVDPFIAGVERALPEGLADHRRSLQHPSLSARQ